MKFRTFCLMIILAAACFVYGKASATELADVLKDKTYIDSGTCYVNAKGEMAKSESEAIGKMQCQRSIKEGDDDHVYFLLFQKGKPFKYLKVHGTTFTSEVIWLNPDSMV